nr:hypothetical protein CFP56_69525 [Quercus suber]
MSYRTRFVHLVSFGRRFVRSRNTLRFLATKRGPDVDDEELRAAREWLEKLSPDTIPKNIYDISFSRSSGPATLRVSTSAMLAHIPKILHRPILASRYHAAKSSHIVVQADDSRKQNENVIACYRRVHEMITTAGHEVIPNETSPEQLERVKSLQKAEAAGRRKMKEFQSSKKNARRSGGRGDHE